MAHDPPDGAVVYGMGVVFVDADQVEDGSPLGRLQQTLDGLDVGAVVTVHTSDVGLVGAIRDWCRSCEADGRVEFLEAIAQQDGTTLVLRVT